jgi:YHS domain-containing protein
MTTDPVCGKQVDDELSAIKEDYDGRTFNFCSEECEERFQVNPEPYRKAA